ncbi:MAG: phosphoglycerate mutase family protein [Alphaproteobacteria bacterium]|nr:phosphoglycerate mutase family protein [Alphaproteobacteria bacterium]
MQSKLLKNFVISLWVGYGILCDICFAERTTIMPFRHMTTGQNEDGKTHGAGATILTQQSIKDLQQLAQFGAENGANIDAIFCGPDERHVISAIALVQGAQSCGKIIPVEYMTGLKELDLGEFENTSRREVAAVVKKLIPAIRLIKPGYTVPEDVLPDMVRNDKSLRSLFRSCEKAMTEFCQALGQIIKEDQRRGGGGHYMLCTSSGVINLFMQQFDPEYFHPNFPNLASLKFKFNPCNKKLYLESGNKELYSEFGCYQILGSDVGADAVGAIAIDPSKIEAIMPNIPERLLTPTRFSMGMGEDGEPLDMPITDMTKEEDGKNLDEKFGDEDSDSEGEDVIIEHSENLSSDEEYSDPEGGEGAGKATMKPVSMWCPTPIVSRGGVLRPMERQDYPYSKSSLTPSVSLGPNAFLKLVSGVNEEGSSLELGAGVQKKDLGTPLQGSCSFPLLPASERPFLGIPMADFEEISHP